MQLPLISSCLGPGRTRDDSLYTPAFVFWRADMDLAKALGAFWRPGSLQGWSSYKEQAKQWP